jgi:hypothetical protein
MDPAGDDDLDAAGGHHHLDDLALPELPERIRRRMDRLREELEDAGVALPAVGGTALLREIDRARFPRRHERRFPSYGGIVSIGDDAPVTAALDRLGTVRLPSPPEAARGIRQMADGVQSFAHVTSESAELVLLASPVGREIELVRLRRSLGPHAALVCRSVDGTVRVFGPRQIVVFDGTSWWTKPDAHDYAISVQRAMPDAPEVITQHILDFCVHTAGPGAGGTMLVWRLDGQAVADLDQRSTRMREPLPRSLPLTLPVAHSAIRHLLFQVDGAASVSPDGDVVEIGLHLRPSREAHQRIAVPTRSGTRHAAAQRCSFDVPSAIFFVVSEDGPVTVYVRGRAVASIDMATDETAEGDATAPA